MAEGDSPSAKRRSLNMYLYFVICGNLVVSVGASLRWAAARGNAAWRWKSGRSCWPGSSWRPRPPAGAGRLAGAGWASAAGGAEPPSKRVTGTWSASGETRQSSWAGGRHASTRRRSGRTREPGVQCAVWVLYSAKATCKIHGLYSELECNLKRQGVPYF